jgi:hypothetical protein
MSLKPADIISLGMFVLGCLSFMSAKARKKYVHWVLWAIAGIALITGMFFSDTEKAATSQTANVYGEKSQILQAAPGSTINNTTINNGVSDATLEVIRNGMREAQKQEEAKLKESFPDGWIIFTATERREIIPLDSPMEQIVKFHWTNHYSVDLSPTRINLQLPDFDFLNPDGSIRLAIQHLKLDCVREAGHSLGMQWNTNYLVMFQILSTGKDGVIIAMGLHPPHLLR